MSNRRGFMGSCAATVAGMFAWFLAAKGVAKTKGIEATCGMHAEIGKCFPRGTWVRPRKDSRDPAFQPNEYGFVLDTGIHGNLFIWNELKQKIIEVRPECVELDDPGVARTRVVKTNKPVKEAEKLYCIVMAGVIPTMPNEDFYPLNVRPASDPPDKNDRHRCMWLEQVPTIENETTKGYEKNKEEGKIPKDAPLWPRTRQFCLVPEIQIGTKSELIQLMAERMARAFDCHSKGPHSDEQIDKAQEILREARRDNHVVVRDNGVAHAPLMCLNHPIGKAYDKQLAKMRAKQVEIDKQTDPCA